MRSAFAAGMAVCLAGFVAPLTAQADDADAVANSDSTLAASTAPPWNPPTAVHSGEGWESALRLPLRVATFPLSLMGDALEASLRYLENSRFAGNRALASSPVAEPGASRGSGFKIMPATLGDRTGFGGAVQYRPSFLGGVPGARISGSTRAYNRTELDLAWGPAQIAYDYDWRPQERFFGIGMATSHDQPSTYAVRRQFYRLGFGVPWRKINGKPPKNTVQVWAGPRESIMRDGRGDGPSFDDAYPQTAPLRNLRREHFAYGARATLDRRTGLPHWGRGFRLTGQIDRYDPSIQALAIRDAHTDAPTFTRFTTEGEVGTSFMRDPHTFRLAIRTVTHTGDFDGHPLLLSDLMSLGGHQGLAGYEPGRFHDVDLVVGKFTYIFPLVSSVEFDIHAETGGVYPRLQDARLSSFRNSYGIALRPRLTTGVVASIGFDWSSESFRIIYTFAGVN